MNSSQHEWSIIYILVGGLEHFLFFHILGTRSPFDSFDQYFSERLKPRTSIIYIYIYRKHMEYHLATQVFSSIWWVVGLLSRISSPFSWNMWINTIRLAEHDFLLAQNHKGLAVISWFITCYNPIKRQIYPSQPPWMSNLPYHKQTISIIIIIKSQLKSPLSII